jgi:hypothetical protein
MEKKKAELVRNVLSSVGTTGNMMRYMRDFIGGTAEATRSDQVGISYINLHLCAQSRCVDFNVHPQYANLLVLKVKGPARLLELRRLSKLVHGNPKHIILLNFPETTLCMI